MAPESRPPRTRLRPLELLRWILLAAVALTGPAVVAVAASVLPWRWPTVDDLTAWLAAPLTLRSVAVAAALVAVSVWVILAATVLSATTRRTGWLARLPLPSPAKTALLGLAGAAALTGAGKTLQTQQPIVTNHDQPELAPDPAQRAAGSVARTDYGTAAPRMRAQPADTGPGIELVDGSWIPQPLAETVAAAAAAVWWQLRRDYRPHARPAASRDTDLAPPAPAIAAITAHLTADDDGPASTPTQRPPSPPHRPLLHPTDLPIDGVALTGDGGTAAARGILISALLTGKVHVHTTAHTMNGLLGAQHNPTSTRLHIAADVDSLLDHLHRPRAEPAITIVTAATSDDTTRLATALRDRPATAIILGPWPNGPTWHVDADGTTHTRDGRPPQRLCILTATVGADLLTLTTAAGAHTGPDTPAAPTLGHPTAMEAAWRTNLRLTLLGDIRLEHHGHTVHIRRTAGWQILTYLAIHPAGATTYKLLTAIWPHHRPHTITGRLYTTISELRRQLPTPSTTPVIERDGDTYRLNPEIIDVDLWHLTAAHHTATTTPDPATRQLALRTLTDNYTGELAANRPWPWLHQPRETIRRHALDAYTTLAQHAAPPAALDLLERAVHVDPTNRHLQHTVDRRSPRE